LTPAIVIEIFQKIFGGMDLVEIAKATGIVAAVGTVINAITRGILNYATTRYHSRLKTYVIRVKARLPAELLGKITFHCLIVRYGTDQYIEKMASEIDRQNGQLQNRIIDIKTRGGVGKKDTEFTLELPVHRRLGTQFKCFTEAKKDLPPLHKEVFLNDVMAFLASTGIASEISISSSEHQHRVYFLLNRFASVTTVDGFKNNHCFPE